MILNKKFSGKKRKMSMFTGHIQSQIAFLFGLIKVLI